MFFILLQYLFLITRKTITIKIKLPPIIDKIKGKLFFSLILFSFKIYSSTQSSLRGYNDNFSSLPFLVFKTPTSFKFTYPSSEYLLIFTSLSYISNNDILKISQAPSRGLSVV